MMGDPWLDVIVVGDKIMVVTLANHRLVEKDKHKLEWFVMISKIMVGYLMAAQ